MRDSGVHKRWMEDFGWLKNQEVLASGVCIFKNFPQLLNVDIKYYFKWFSQTIHLAVQLPDKLCLELNNCVWIAGFCISYEVIFSGNGSKALSLLVQEHYSHFLFV